MLADSPFLHTTLSYRSIAPSLSASLPYRLLTLSMPARFLARSLSHAHSKSHRPLRFPFSNRPRQPSTVFSDHSHLHPYPLDLKPFSPESPPVRTLHRKELNPDPLFCFGNGTTAGRNHPGTNHRSSIRLSTAHICLDLLDVNVRCSKDYFHRSPLPTLLLYNLPRDFRCATSRRQTPHC